MWKVEYKKQFLKELSKLPESVQAQAEKTVFEDLIWEHDCEDCPVEVLCLKEKIQEFK